MTTGGSSAGERVPECNGVEGSARFDGNVRPSVRPAGEHDPGANTTMKKAAQRAEERVCSRANPERAISTRPPLKYPDKTIPAYRKIREPGPRMVMARGCLLRLSLPLPVAHPSPGMAPARIRYVARYNMHLVGDTKVMDRSLVRSRTAPQRVKLIRRRRAFRRQ